MARHILTDDIRTALTNDGFHSDDAIIAFMIIDAAIEKMNVPDEMVEQLHETATEYMKKNSVSVDHWQATASWLAYAHKFVSFLLETRERFVTDCLSLNDTSQINLKYSLNKDGTIVMYDQLYSELVKASDHIDNISNVIAWSSENY